jgi:hypothetical protein
VSDAWFCWSLCDPDLPPGTFFREGQGFENLNVALRDLAARIGEETPEGYITGGNIQIYWYRAVVEAEV